MDRGGERGDRQRVAAGVADVGAGRAQGVVGAEHVHLERALARSRGRRRRAGSWAATPALATTTSSPPSASTAASTAASTCSRGRRRRTRPRARRRSGRRTSASRSGSSPASATRAPRSWRRSASAAPMPRAAPVMRTRRPSRDGADGPVGDHEPLLLQESTGSSPASRASIQSVTRSGVSGMMSPWSRPRPPPARSPGRRRTAGRTASAPGRCTTRSSAVPEARAAAGRRRPRADLVRSQQARGRLGLGRVVRPRRGRPRRWGIGASLIWSRHRSRDDLGRGRRRSGADVVVGVDLGVLGGGAVEAPSSPTMRATMWSMPPKVRVEHRRPAPTTRCRPARARGRARRPARGRRARRGRPASGRCEIQRSPAWASGSCRAARTTSIDGVPLAGLRQVGVDLPDRAEADVVGGRPHALDARSRGGTSAAAGRARRGDAGGAVGPGR